MAPGTEKRLREVLKRLEPLPNCGPAKRRKLKEKFQTEAALLEAGPEDIAKINGVGDELAKSIHGVIHGELEPHRKWAGKVHAVIWNKVTHKIIRGACAPLEENADAWLQKHADTHERYTGQDKVLKSPSQLPEESEMPDGDYAQWLEQAADGGRLDDTIAQYGLRRATIVPGSALGRTDLFVVLATSAAQCGALTTSAALRQDMVTELGQQIPEPIMSQLLPRALEAASRVLKRPIWVWTSCALERNVYKVEPEGLDPRLVTPLRLGQQGSGPAGWQWCVLLEANDEPTELREPVDDPETEDGAVEAEQQLPDVKDDLSNQLEGFINMINDMEEWSGKQFASLDLKEYSAPVTELLTRLRSGEGLDAVMLGDNGVGKSTLVNLMLLNTSIDDSSYKKRSDNYVPEAILQQLFDGKSDPEHQPPTLAELLSAEEPSALHLRREEAHVLFVSPPDGQSIEEAKRGAQERCDSMETGIRAYCEGPSQKPKLKRYILPEGEEVAKTSLHTRVRYGELVHLLIEHYSVEELQRQAFVFVTLRIDLGDDDPPDFHSERSEYNAMLDAFRIYHKITAGREYAADLPGDLDDLLEPDDLPKRWEDVKVHPDLLAIVSSRYLLYLGRGESLQLDRTLIHDVVEKMNNRKGLERIAVKQMMDYQPCAVLEGGNGFVDLPGLGDIDAGCEQQSREGVQNAGVIFVVLRRDLGSCNDTLEMMRKYDVMKRALRTNLDEGDEAQDGMKKVDVVFLFNRETATDYDKTMMLTQEEVARRKNLETETRALWLSELQRTNKQLVKAGQDGRTEEEIKAIAEGTHMRTIYPMAHSSFKLNWQHSDMNKDEAAQAWQVSNIYWLLGVLEKLNRDSLVESLHHVATKVMRELVLKLQGSLDDAMSTSKDGVPRAMMERAAKLLKSAGTLTGGVYHQVEQLTKNVEALAHGRDASAAAASSQRPRNIKEQLEALVADFMDNDPSVRQYLTKAAEKQAQSWPALKKKIKKLSVGLKVVAPVNKGAWHGYELTSVVFGSRNGQVTADFQVLIDSIFERITEIKQLIVNEIAEAADSLTQPGGSSSSAALGGGDTTTRVLTILKETFVDSDVSKPLDNRFSANTFFSANRQGPARHKNIPMFLRKTAEENCAKALRNTILNKSGTVTTVEAVKQLIEDNLNAAREEWVNLTVKSIQSLVAEQWRTLSLDLTHGRGKGKANHGLLRSMLLAFLQHILQTGTVQSNSEARAELEKHVKDLRSHKDRLYQLWRSLIKQDDPEELGRGAARYVERRRQREQLVREAGGLTIGRPDVPMLSLPLAALNPRRTVVTELMFHSGNLDMFATFKKDVRKRFKLFEGRTVNGMPNVFSAVCLAAWTERKLRARLSVAEGIELQDVVEAAAQQLRKVAVSQLAHIYRTDAMSAKINGVLGESVHDYLDRLNRNEYNGDLLCLHALATHWRMNFVIHLPGEEQPMLILHNKQSRELRNQQVLAHHLVVASDPDELAQADGSPASNFKPTWFYLTKLGVKVDNTKDKVVTVEISQEERREKRQAHREMMSSPEAQQQQQRHQQRKKQRTTPS